MSNKIIFSSIRGSGNNNGTLEKDDKGYYKVRLGAINSFNQSGDFYLADGVNDLVSKNGSVLKRRLDNGYLKGEAGHPKFIPGTMSKADFYSRNLRIELTNVSHHIREVILEPTDKDSGLLGGGKVVNIDGWVKPSGPLGDALLKDLEDPDINVAFSIRCFSKDAIINGVNIKKILQIVTWDWVLEPGIAKANKWSKIANESLDTTDIFTIDLDEISDQDKISECYNCSLESKDEQDITMELINRANDDSSPYIKIKEW